MPPNSPSPPPTVPSGSVFTGTPTGPMAANCTGCACGFTAGACSCLAWSSFFSSPGLLVLELPLEEELEDEPLEDELLLPLELPELDPLDAEELVPDPPDVPPVAEDAPDPEAEPELVPVPAAAAPGALADCVVAPPVVDVDPAAAAGGADAVTAVVAAAGAAEGVVAGATAVAGGAVGITARVAAEALGAMLATDVVTVATVCCVCSWTTGLAVVSAITVTAVAHAAGLTWHSFTTCLITSDEIGVLDASAITFNEPLT